VDRVEPPCPCAFAQLGEKAPRLIGKLGFLDLAAAQGALAPPLIGTLDSARTQTVMESLLEQIVASGAEIAIIDITGLPTVDTLVAQH
jgi:hypothetical protein